MRRIFLFLLSIAFLLTPAVTADNRPAVMFKDIMVRVAVVREAREISLSIDGGYILRDAKSGVIVAQGVRLPKTTVRLLDKGLFIGGQVFAVKRLLVEPLRDSAIHVNRHRFRGEVHIIRTDDNRMTVVNSINIEDYIKGVLYHEVSHHWPMETLKAQAVAARTYAIYAMSNNKKDFDVTNDIYSQVYGGRNSERYRTGLAVDRTTGQILYFQGKILPSYFHATCAGMTEDVAQLWDMKTIPPLSGVACQFCQDSPHMKWKRNFQLKMIQELMNNRGIKMGLILEIQVMERNRSNRVKMLKIIGRAGEVVTMKGEEFRQMLGPNALKSNNYEIVMQGYYVDFVGAGWGHGVGMCQWGARGMAAQQFNYRQILNYYYPGAQIVDYHDVR